MNLLLVDNAEINSEGLLVLRDRRLEHLRHVLKTQQGDSLRIGVVNGNTGHGEVLRINADEALLRVELRNAPPTPMDLCVVLALPRPKMLRRVLRGLAEIGVKDIHLIHSYRVEKSYWQSPLLQASALEEALRAGLEQCMDTRLPTIRIHRRFRPFAEDVLPTLCRGRDALLADPRATAPFPVEPGVPGLLLIGPEGGFIEFENDLMARAGARGVSMGPRILRVETALQSALGAYLISGTARDRDLGMNGVTT